MFPATRLFIEIYHKRPYYGNMAKNIKITGFLIILMFTASLSFGQARGAILDENYDNLPRRADIYSLSYEGLPGSYSLKQYAPLPGDQTDYGTCVAWAASYAARTILESIALNRLNQTETTQNAFSPVYVYRNIRPDDPECIYGTQIFTALDFMRDTGTTRMLNVEREVSFPRVNLAYYRTTRKYPIAGYVTLFSRDERQKLTLITRIIKKSLTEGKPVIIAMNTPDSFIDAKDVWRPPENPAHFYYAHALCVVGYDDQRFGGAFEIQNSWGRKWGNGGYIWIPYQTFVDFVYEGYELIDNISYLSDSLMFDGYIRMDVIDQQTRTAAFNLTENYFYTAAEIFTEAAEVSFVIGTGESSYVYSFRAVKPLNEDYFYMPSLLFPHNGISPLLNYSGSAVTLPGENRTITLDTPGTEYIITLYAKQALDIHSIMRVFSSAQGSINKRLASAIGDGYTTELVFNETEAAFTVSPDNPRAVAALVIAIERR